MAFLILAYDAKDAGAFERRKTHRAAHLAVMQQYKDLGKMKIGAAILDDSGKMIGSCIIADFASRQELDQWLAKEPFAVEKVWGDIQIQPCAIAPIYAQ